MLWRGVMAGGSAAFWQSDPDHADFDLIIEYYDAVVVACLASHGSGPLDEAVARFVAPVNAAFVESSDPESAVETILWAAWTAVVEAAEASGGAAQARLVELVMKIRGEDVPARADGQRDCPVWGLRVYADLPVFGAQMREEWDVTRDASAGPEAWANLNAFAARLTAAGEDFSLYALWTLRDYLEEEHAASSADLAVVAQWFTICGPLLASRSTSGYAPPEWSAAARVGRLCVLQGITEGGFSPQRWEFWRTRLEACAKGPDAAAARAALTAFNSAAS
jgi:hypothetical protein